MTMRKYVLLVENETDLRDAIALIIRQHGYHVATAQDGKDALATIANLGRPAVILLNLQMPRMNGWELREQVWRRPDLADVPFVLISGSAHIAAEAQRLQAVDYFQKPIHFPRLLQVLSKHCK